MLFSDLVYSTTVQLVKDKNAGCFLSIRTPRLHIRSVEAHDIDFFQQLWANADVMEKFAEGKPRLYSGNQEEKQAKIKAGAPYDYALWRIKTSPSSWLNRRQQNNIWHGLVILNHENEPMGHIVLGGGELAYFLKPEFWHQGYTTEAAISLICIALPEIARRYPEYDIPEELEATVRTDHIISQNVLTKTGFEINQQTPKNEKFGCERYIVKAPSAQFITAYENYLAQRQVVPYLSNQPFFSNPQNHQRKPELNEVIARAQYTAS